MTDDIHAIIAAAKRWDDPDDTSVEWHTVQHPMDLLADHAIAMAEALARIATQSIGSDRGPPWDYPCDIARECLDKIVREAQ